MRTSDRNDAIVFVQRTFDQKRRFEVGQEGKHMGSQLATLERFLHCVHNLPGIARFEIPFVSLELNKRNCTILLKGAALVALRTT
mmetsp:Transcript_20308/g.50692  ORF Transcript_20308/g.50692 Transcript_20308/m.50692 type:complete len:85 (-) Transcript_20308:524-778(-)